MSVPRWRPRPTATSPAPSTCSCAGWEATATGKVLRARLGDDGLAEAERESAYFFADELPAVAAWSFGPAEAARVAAPALLIGGAQSRPWFRENVAILAELLPDARTQTLPELDHLAPLTHPAELAVTIGRFVRHLASTPS